MSFQVLDIQKKEQLHQQIERLAMLLVTADLSGNESLSVLEQLRDAVETVFESSRAAAFEEGIALTGALKSSLAEAQTGRKHVSGLEGELQSGITELQNALARAGSGAASPQAAKSDAASGSSSGPVESMGLTSSALSQDPELVGDFLMESGEHLSTIETQLLTIEQDPTNADALNSVFRAFHTIKGLAGFLEFAAVQASAHEVETLLDKARNHELLITSPVVDVILEGADHLKTWMQYIASVLAGTPSEEPADGCALHERIRAHINGTQAEPRPEEATSDLATLAEAVVPGVKLGAESEQAAAWQPGPETQAQSPVAESSALKAASELSKVSPQSPTPKERASQKPSKKAGEMQLKAPAVAANGPEGTNKNQTPAAAPVHASAQDNSEHRVSGLGSAETRSVKVDTAKLDYLVDMVGEMVIAQSLIRHDPDMLSAKNSRLLRNVSQATRITAEVQKTAMAMRMLPVGQVFGRMNRLVRDLTRKSGKNAELEISGEETELDRTIVEELADPLMHMVRNSLDHGIELPDERMAAGKPAKAKVILRAYHQGGNILIEVGDDGRGLNREKIVKKAKERKLIEHGDHMADSDVFALIFEPGFSTADQITDISGRGVGMDVVKRQIQKLRGRIDIQSVRGQGTTFFLKLPLTLAIIDGLVIGVGEERYIVPIFAVHESLRPTEDMVSTLPNGSEVALIRGALLPIVRLNRRFGIEARTENLAESLFVICEGHGKRFCIVIDELIGKQEVVIKSLGKIFKNVPGIAGGAILGDGRVGLILDVEAIHGGTSNGVA